MRRCVADYYCYRYGRGRLINASGNHYSFYLLNYWNIITKKNCAQLTLKVQTKWKISPSRKLRVHIIKFGCTPRRSPNPNADSRALKQSKKNIWLSQIRTRENKSTLILTRYLFPLPWNQENRSSVISSLEPQSRFRNNLTLTRKSEVEEEKKKFNILNQ